MATSCSRPSRIRARDVKAVMGAVAPRRTATVRAGRNAPHPHSRPRPARCTPAPALHAAPPPPPCTLHPRPRPARCTPAPALRPAPPHCTLHPHPAPHAPAPHSRSLSSPGVTARPLLRVANSTLDSVVEIGVPVVANDETGQFQPRSSWQPASRGRTSLCSTASQMVTGPLRRTSWPLEAAATRSATATFKRASWSS
jgi:hypothetical protein